MFCLLTLIAAPYMQSCKPYTLTLTCRFSAGSCAGVARSPRPLVTTVSVHTAAEAAAGMQHQWQSTAAATPTIRPSSSIPTNRCCHHRRPCRCSSSRCSVRVVDLQHQLAVVCSVQHAVMIIAADAIGTLQMTAAPAAAARTLTCLHSSCVAVANQQQQHVAASNVPGVAVII